MVSTFSPGQPLPDAPDLSEVAQIFMTIHLDAMIKRDLAIWFAEHPHGTFALYELVSALKHGRAPIGAGIKGLEEAGVIEVASGNGRHVWQLTSHAATRQILFAVARYWRQHPETRAVIVGHRAA